MATLHVAGVNTPLFITTLLHDILDAPSATHRNATLKLLGFMIRKVSFPSTLQSGEFTADAGLAPNIETSRAIH